jgi:hypothetical protein
LTILSSLNNKLINDRWLCCFYRQIQQYWYKGLKKQALMHLNSLWITEGVSDMNEEQNKRVAEFRFSVISSLEGFMSRLLNS